MPQCLRYDLRFRTTQQSQTGERMPEIVEAHLTEARLTYYPGEVMGDSAGVERAAVLIAEDQVIKAGRLHSWAIVSTLTIRWER